MLLRTIALTLCFLLLSSTTLAQAQDESPIVDEIDAFYCYEVDVTNPNANDAANANATHINLLKEIFLKVDDEWVLTNLSFCAEDNTVSAQCTDSAETAFLVWAIIATVLLVLFLLAWFFGLFDDRSSRRSSSRRNNRL